MNGDRYQFITHGQKFCCWHCIKQLPNPTAKRAKQMIHKKERHNAKLKLRDENT